MYELTIKIASLELALDIMRTAMSAGATVESREVGERIISPERRIPASTSRKIRELQNVLGVSTNGAGKPKRRRGGGINRGYSDAAREILADGKDHTPLEIKETLIKKGIVEPGYNISSMFVRMAKQGEVKRTAPGTYRATKLLAPQTGE